MQPEILHRCDSCGASIREPAMFCPECGKPLTSVTENKSKLGESQTVIKSATNKTNAEVSAGQTGDGPKTTVTESAKAEAVAAAKVVTGDQQRPGARERTRETLQRASTAARGAIEDNVKRVEKIHHVSTVMLEEASYDPSLRFVLVALGLFIVFLILLVVSKVMG